MPPGLDLKLAKSSIKSDVRVVDVDEDELELLEVFLPETDAVPAAPDTESGPLKFVGTSWSTYSASAFRYVKAAWASVALEMVRSDRPGPVPSEPEGQPDVNQAMHITPSVQTPRRMAPPIHCCRTTSVGGVRPASPRVDREASTAR
jgi:hypothetical protein